MRRSIAMAVMVVAVAWATAACSGDDSGSDGGSAAADTSAPSATASPSPTPAPWAADAKPERPADEQTDASAQAFAEFSARTVLYVMATGDAPALTEISDLSSCNDCRTWDDTYTSGKLELLSVPTSQPSFTVDGAPTVTDQVFYKVRLSMDIPKGEKVRRDSGEHVDNLSAVKGLPFVADLQWKDDAWVLMRYDFG